MARDSAHVEARDSAHVVARDSAHVVAWDSAHVVARDSATCSKRSQLVDAHGNVFDFTKYPKTVKEWLDKYEVKIDKGHVTLYKGTDGNYKTRNNTQWDIGKVMVAPDWEKITNIECGKALHFCHHPICCEQFLTVKHYLACKVKVSDIVIYKNQPEYPDKIRSKQGLVLYECDRWGKRIDNKVKRDSRGRFCK